MTAYLPLFMPATAKIQDWADELAFWLHLNGAHEEAYKFWKGAFWHRNTPPTAHDAEWCHNLELIGLKLHFKNQPGEAERLFREALDYKETTLSHDDRKVCETLVRIARALVARGRYEEAEAYFRRALEGYPRRISEGHYDVLQVANEFAYTLACQGRTSTLKESEKWARNTLKTRERILGKMHQETIESVWTLGFVLEKAGVREEARHLYERAYEDGRNLLGKEHVDVRDYAGDCDRLNWEDYQLVQYLSF